MKPNLISGRGSPLTILLVEDDAPSALIEGRAMELFGCDVTTVGDGNVAYDLAVRRRFDVIVMDFHLPGMNGLQATAKLRMHESDAHCGRTPILGLTASAGLEEQSACLLAGMDEVLTKPILFPDLYAALDRMRVMGQPSVGQI